MYLKEGPSSLTVELVTLNKDFGDVLVSFRKANIERLSELCQNYLTTRSSAMCKFAHKLIGSHQEAVRLLSNNWEQYSKIVFLKPPKDHRNLDYFLQVSSNPIHSYTQFQPYFDNFNAAIVEFMNALVQEQGGLNTVTSLKAILIEEKRKLELIQSQYRHLQEEVETCFFRNCMQRVREENTHLRIQREDIARNIEHLTSSLCWQSNICSICFERHQQRDQLRMKLQQIDIELSQPSFYWKSVPTLREQERSNFESKKGQIEEILWEGTKKIIEIQLKAAGLNQQGIDAFQSFLTPLNYITLKAQSIIQKMDSTNSHCMSLLLDKKLQQNVVLCSLRGIFSSFCTLQFGLHGDPGRCMTMEFDASYQFILSPAITSVTVNERDKCTDDDLLSMFM